MVYRVAGVSAETGQLPFGMGILLCRARPLDVRVALLLLPAFGLLLLAGGAYPPATPRRRRCRRLPRQPTEPPPQRPDLPLLPVRVHLGEHVRRTIPTTKRHVCEACQMLPRDHAGFRDADRAPRRPPPEVRHL